MSDRDLISCVLPVFNAERYLAEALDSIFAQSHRPLEVIVVDDGSTDGSARIAESYGAQLQLLTQSNAGPAAARNRGLDAATGAYVAFLDADDLWHPDKLARQIERFRQRPELDYCITHVETFWTPEFEHLRAHYADPRSDRTLAGYLLQSLLCRRATFDTVGRFDPALRTGEDTDWFLRAADAGTVMEVLDAVLVRRRFHPDNMTRHAGDALQDNLFRVLKASVRRRKTGPDAQPSSAPVATPLPGDE